MYCCSVLPTIFQTSLAYKYFTPASPCGWLETRKLKCFGENWTTVRVLKVMINRVTIWNMPPIFPSSSPPPQKMETVEFLCVCVFEIPFYDKTIYSVKHNKYIVINTQLATCFGSIEPSSGHFLIYGYGTFIVCIMCALVECTMSVYLY
jgi:hypothetical protein